MKLERRRGDGEFFQEAAFHGHGDLHQSRKFEG